MFLEGKEKSLEEAIRITDTFSAISGLKINNDKTQVVWIGTKKNSQIRYMRDINFQWDPGIFRVLGIKFSTAVDNMSELNYEGALEQVKKIISCWEKRRLSPHGKITVIKTLVTSKLT